MIEAPNRKVGAGGLAGALAFVVVYLLGVAGIETSAELAVALTTIFAFVVSYFVREPPRALPPAASRPRE